MLIPLHNSAEWQDALREQLVELQGVARIIVSDATGGDATLDALRAFIDHPSIDWIGPRALAPGWVAHANDPQGRATTEFVMWLPHDDQITRAWIREAEAHLDLETDAVAACGPIDPLSFDSQGRGEAIDVPSFVTMRDPVDRVATAVDRLLIGQSSELGILFRSVVRRSAAPLLPPGVVGDDWADLLWSLRLLSRGPVAPISARYGKRWHDRNTHGGWGDHTTDNPDLVRAAVSSSIEELSAEDRAHVFTRVWVAEVLRLREELERREAYWHAALATLWRDVNRSASWRVTAPARAAASALRALFAHRPRANSPARTPRGSTVG